MKKTILAIACMTAALAHASTPPLEPASDNPVKMTAPAKRHVGPKPTNTKTADTVTANARNWLQANNVPSTGDDGRVMFTYGAGLPVVVCAPLRICVIELQPGERVNREVQIGDSVRWSITPAESGTGKTAQTLIIIKPKESGLDTNLVIPTDKRNYYIRLVSNPTEYVARVAFNYPEEAQAAWDAYNAKQQDLAKSVVAEMPALSIEKLNFTYEISGEANFRPIRVVDNGMKTYIQLPEGSRADEIPVLVVLNEEGKEQLVNSRFINGWFEVDRLFTRAALIIGVGSDQSKVVITNKGRVKPSFGRFYGE